MIDQAKFEKPVLKDISYFISEIQKSNYFSAAIKSFANGAENTPFSLGRLSDLAPNGIDSEFTILQMPNKVSESNTWYRALINLFNAYN
jgi:hypothetical protein